MIASLPRIVLHGELKVTVREYIESGLTSTVKILATIVSNAIERRHA